MERQPRPLLDQRTREPGSVSCDGGWNQWLPHTLTRPSLGALLLLPGHIRGYAGMGLDGGNLVRWTQIAVAIPDKPCVWNILVCGNQLPRGRGAKRPKRQMAPALRKSKTGLQQQRQLHLCTQSMKRWTC